MTAARRAMLAVGVLCGLELVAAIAIGGAGLAHLFGLEAALVAVSLGGAAALGVWMRHRSH